MWDLFVASLKQSINIYLQSAKSQPSVSCVVWLSCILFTVVLCAKCLWKSIYQKKKADFKGNYFQPLTKELLALGTGKSLLTVPLVCSCMWIRLGAKTPFSPIQIWSEIPGRNTLIRPNNAHADWRCVLWNRTWSSAWQDQKKSGRRWTNLLDVADGGVALWGEVVSFRQQGEDVRAGETVAGQVLHLHRGVPLLDLVGGNRGYPLKVELQNPDKMWKKQNKTVVLPHPREWSRIWQAPAWRCPEGWMCRSG